MLEMKKEIVDKPISKGNFIRIIKNRSCIKAEKKVRGEI
jgi:hypothetical protein